MELEGAGPVSRCRVTVEAIRSASSSLRQRMANIEAEVLNAKRSRANGRRSTATGRSSACTSIPIAITGKIEVGEKHRAFQSERRSGRFSRRQRTD